MSFTSGLKDTVDVKRRADADDGYGGIAEGTPTTLVTGWCCRLMAFRVHDKEATRREFGAYPNKLRKVTGDPITSATVVAGANDYLEDADGNTFTIVGIDSQYGTGSTKHHESMVVREDE